MPEPFKTYFDAHPELRPLAEIRENPFNPEMIFTFGDYGVKLHYAPLDEVIALETRPHIEQKILVFDLDATLGREAKLLPGMRELLDAVRELKILMVVWTARGRASMV